MLLVILEKILLEFLHSETDNRYILHSWYFFFFVFFILRGKVQLPIFCVINLYNLCATRRMVVLLVREEILDIYFQVLTLLSPSPKFLLIIRVKCLFLKSNVLFRGFQQDFRYVFLTNIEEKKFVFCNFQRGVGGKKFSIG